MAPGDDDRAERILVVDDDARDRLVMAATLARGGFQTEEAASGAQALQLLGQQRFSAVLLDNRMPGMSGREVITALRSDETNRTLPVLLVTGDDEVAHRVVGLEEGASDYIVKPFHPDELVARIKAHLREQAAWAEVLERRLAERAAIAKTLCRMYSTGSATRTAEVVCREVRQLRGLAGTSLVVFVAHGVAVPLALQGTAPWGMHEGMLLPLSLAEDLERRSLEGPWLDREDGVVAVAPLGPEGASLGLLTLTAAPDPAWGSDDLDGQLLAAAIDFATIATGLLAPSLFEEGKHESRRNRLADVLRREAFMPVFQPIFSLADQRIVGFEALTRFTDGVRPDVRFAEAVAVELGVQLETATMAAAVKAAGSVLPHDAWLSLNVSPALILEEGVIEQVAAEAPMPLVLELTEHDPVHDYGELRRVVDSMRPRVRLSVDDAGSGFNNLRHVVALEPEFIKLDQSWVRDIHEHPVRQALVAGLRHFADQSGSELIGEGIETNPERGKLMELQVRLGQGFLLGHPSPSW